MKKALAIFAFLAVTMLQGGAWATQRIQIGVLSFLSKEDTVKQWSPTAALLQAAIPDSEVLIVPLVYEELNAQVEARKIDFVFTNPEHYVVLRNAFQISPMVTMNRLIQGREVSAMGSVIFSNAQNTEITELHDVKGKRVAAVGLFSLGGFLAAADVLRVERIDLLSYSATHLSFLGVPHSKVVDNVLAGKAEVGIVRTGVLEDMVQKGKLDMSRVRVLNRQPESLFPQALSSRLFPEWPFAAMPQTEPQLIKKVAMVLLGIPPASEAAKAGGFSGFSPPANYAGVEDLMRRLKVYPGVQKNAIWVDIWEQYSTPIQLSGLLVLVVGVGMSGYLLLKNRQLRTVTQLLEDAQVNLDILAVAFNSQVGLLITDKNTRIVRANDAFCATLGYTEQELAGNTTAILRGEGVQGGFLEGVVWKQLTNQGFWKGELMCRHAKGFDIPCIVTVTAVRGQHSGLNGFVGSFVDISDQKRTESEIRQLAYFDNLTQLPNRRLFFERLQSHMAQGLSERSLGALMFIDLDHFKFLNDSHGHSVGDELLKLIAGRLNHLCGDNALAARLGGDEFVVMLTQLGEEPELAMEAAIDFAQRIKDSLLAPYLLTTSAGLEEASHKLRYACSGSIGVALFAQVEEEITEVLKRADVAMYQAKQAGRNTIRQFDPSTQQWLNNRLTMLSALNTAIADNQFELYYQVQADARNVPVGAECLLRWKHPDLGWVSPADFIPLAEESGAISQIGKWVMQAACATLSRWTQDARLQHLSLSVNVSPKQFVEHDFIDHLASTLKQHGLSGERLILEITEGTVLQNVGEVIEKMVTLRNLGVRMSIDDFGTGYSSLSYLQRLPLSELKIDRAFVNDMTEKEESYAIVSAILALAGKLHFSVVTEGVETVAQRSKLLELGASIFQGYLIAKPCNLDQFEALVATMATE